jgi:hypothetical protein
MEHHGYMISQELFNWILDNVLSAFAFLIKNNEANSYPHTDTSC